MKEKIKKTIHIIFNIFFIFLLVFIISVAFFNLLYRFDIINASTCLILALCSTILIIVVSIVMHKLSKKIMFISRIEKWVVAYYYRIMLFAVVFLLFTNSLNKEVFISMEDAKEMLSLQWTIFGISITIFIVWNILAQQIFDKKIEITKEEDRVQMLKKYLNNKKIYVELMQEKSYTLSFIIINIFIIIYTTFAIYLQDGAFNILKQTLLILSFYFCTNTLVQLFLDILQPLLKKKKETIKSLNSDKDIDSLIQQIIIIHNELNSLTISDNEKQEYNKQLQTIIEELCELKGIIYEEERNDK